MEPQVPSPRELRNFGLLLAGMIAGVFGVAIPWLAGRDARLWPWVTAGALALWALAAPALLRPVYRAWMAFGEVMGFVMNRIILGVVFFLIVLPTGMIMRLRGRDPMRRKRNSAADTYRVDSHVTDPTNMGRPF